MIKVNTRIGKQTLQIELPNMKAVHQFNEVYGGLPTKCDNCQSENIYISYKNPGDNDYFTIRCGDCTADANFGIHKKGNTLYWKDEKMTIYVPPADVDATNPNTTDPGSAQNLPIQQGQQPATTGQPIPEEDDLPF